MKNIRGHASVAHPIPFAPRARVVTTGTMIRVFLLLLVGTPVLAHPVPESPQWLVYPGGDGPGKGRHIMHIAADHKKQGLQLRVRLGGKSPKGLLEPRAGAIDHHAGHNWRGDQSPSWGPRIFG